MASRKSCEIVRLLATVAQLGETEQNRILRIVRLLACVPATVQRNTRVMLRELLDAEPSSMLECIAGLDELVEYLEHEALAHDGPAKLYESYEHVSSSRLLN